jgi:hypothetical protein
MMGHIKNRSPLPIFTVDTIANDTPDTWYEDCNLPPQAARYLGWGLSSHTQRTYTTPRNDIVHFCAVR